MIKLVVSDVDGTLLLKNSTAVGKDVLDAIKLLQSSRKTVAVASGRTYGSLEKLFNEVKKDLYFICCDGALTVCNDKVLYTKQIPIGDVMSVLRRSEYDNCGVMLCTPKTTFVVRGSEDFSIMAEAESGEDTYYLDKLYDLKEPVVKISVWSKDGGAKPLNFLPKSLRVSYNSNGWCEYTSAIANKGIAVSDLQSRLYMSKFDTAAIGDGENDIEMMKKAKISASANDAHTELRELCMYHTTDAASFLIKLCDE